MAGKAIRISLEQSSVILGSDFNGAVTVNYQGRFDGVQINTYVIGTNEQVRFVDLDGRTISIPARLYVGRKEMTGEKDSFEFKARIEWGRKDLPKDTRIRFRAAIIQEHKEIESDIVLVPVSPA